MYNEINYKTIEREYNKTIKQLNALRGMLKVYERTRLDGPWTSKDGQAAQVCMDNIDIQMGILKMIAL